jgi:DNA-binding SARP family transcriptional activator/tetratricopeptide (TPR) repeat protein
VGVLGPVRVWLGGVEVVVGAPLRCAVLAVLASRPGRLVTLGELVDALWGERAPASAEGSVYTYVSGLRSVLEPGRSGRDRGGVLDGDRSGYVLHVDAGDVDAVVAERCRGRAGQLRGSGDLVGALAVVDEGLGLWRGEALAGVPGPFAEVERVRLTELRWSLLEERAEVALGLGRHGEVAAELTALVAEQPLRERLVGLAMTGLYRGGRQAEALELFGRLRVRLAEELGLDPGPELQRLHERILRSDPGLAAPEGAGVVAGGSSGVAVGAVPAQLPHDVSGFTGRVAELAWLRGRVLGESADGLTSMVISAIDGFGGIGKTALVVHVAHQVADRFPDGQLYVDLRGFDPQLPPLTPGEALSRLLRGLGVGAREMPAELDLQAAQYRSLLAGKRMLVLLDNAVSTDQVRQLLPGTPGCSVLVTSRNRLGGLVARHGAQRLTLDVFSLSESIALLSNTVGAGRAAAEAAAVAELARLCGRYPLALRIAAERVSARPAETVAELVEELSSEQDRLDVLTSDEEETDAVRGVFSWSYHALKPEAARLFRLLSLHPGTEFSTEAAAAVAGLPVARTKPLLRTLADGHLLEDAGRNRYRFHDLLRIYATDCAVAEEIQTDQATATRRVLGWYLHTADSAAEITSPGLPRTTLEGAPEGVEALAFADHDSAIAWIDREQLNLVNAVRHAATTGDHDTAWRLAERLRDLFELYRDSSEWVEVMSVAFDSAAAVGDRRGQAAMLNQRGFARSRTGKLQAALDDLHRAKVIYLELGDSAGAARALGNIGVVYYFALEKHDEALSYFNQARQLFEAAGDQDGTARALGNIAQVHQEEGRFEEAYEALQRVLAIFTELSDEIQIARCQTNIAWNRQLAGHTEDAVALHLAALQTADKFGDRWGTATTAEGIASCYLELGEPESAAQYAENAVEGFRSLDNSRHAGALLVLGKAYRTLGKVVDSRRVWEEALALVDGVDPHLSNELRAELSASFSMGAPTSVETRTAST